MYWEVRKNQNESELIHYGIKGMKWGIRRTPEQLGHRTIKAGTKMYRTTASKDESKLTGSTYVTYLQPDRDLYRGAWSYAIKQFGGLKKGDRLYETEYILKEDLNIPSREEQIEVTNHIREKNKGKGLKDYCKRYVERNYNLTEERINDMIEMYREDFGKSESEAIKSYKKQVKYWYDNVYKAIKNYTPEEFFTVATRQFGSDIVTKDEVIKELSKRGYNAMVDQAGVGGMGGLPREGLDALIIFDRQKTLQTESTNKVSKVTEVLATQRYKKWNKEVNKPKYAHQPW